MKRLIMLAVLCAFVLGAAASASAELKGSGFYVSDVTWSSNWGFQDNNDANDARVMDLKQRFDMVFDFVASENLKAVMAIRADGNWGKSATNKGDYSLGAISADGLGIRRAYIDFNWPDTAINVKTGFLPVGLPAAIGGGSFIMDEEVAGAVVSGPITDNVSFVAGYARALNVDAAHGDGHVDAYIAALPMAFDGFTVAPFGMIANIGDQHTATTVTDNFVGLGGVNATASNLTDSDEYSGAYWLGAAFTMDMFDPFVLKADFNYGNVAADNDANDRSGWLFATALEYTGLDFMTPEVFFAYTSGEDGNASKGNGSERMPMMAAANWALGSFFFGGDTFLQGSSVIADRENVLGFWALGLTLKDIQSFTEGLTHTATFMYVQGTNDKDVAYNGLDAEDTPKAGILYGKTLTEEDSLIEIDFNSYYKLYDALTVGVELGYINLDADTGTWGAGFKGGDAWKVTTGLAYKF